MFCDIKIRLSSCLSRMHMNRIYSPSCSPSPGSGAGVGVKGVGVGFSVGMGLVPTSVTCSILGYVAT